MKIKKLHIERYEGIENVDVYFNYDVSFLISDNNVGKTRVLECLEAFYGKNKNECEASIDIELNDEDIIDINDKEIVDNNITIVKEQNKYKVNGKDVTKLLKNNKFGQIIYIPAVTNHDDQLNISKSSSAINDLIKRITNPGIEKSLEKINNDLSEYLEKLKTATNSDVDNIKNTLIFKSISISLDVNDVNAEELIKNNIQLKVSENGGNLENLNNLGSGVQRNIVNSILMNGINPEKFTLVLYDEPETFISTSSQRQLICRINEMASKDHNNKLQFIISTHSPDIIFRNPDIHKKIIKLHKENKNIRVCQFDEDKFNSIVENVNNKLISKGINEKYLITSKNLSATVLKWWDRNRVSALFESKVLLVEGLTEEIFVDTVFAESNIPYMTSINGKFSYPLLYIIFTNIFEIDLYAVIDKDDGTKINHSAFNSFIDENFANNYIIDPNIENKLGYDVPVDGHKKPYEMLNFLHENNFKNENIDKLKQDITLLFDL